VFYGCSGLEFITIPANITEFCDNVFNGCTNLQRIYYLGSTITFTGGTNQFANKHSELRLYTKETYKNAIWTVVDNTLKKESHPWPYVEYEIPYTPAKEYTTFCRDFDVDFSAATGLKAGVALSSTLAGNKLSFSVKSSVPAGTGVLLKGTAGATYTLKIAEESPEAIVGNLMKGVVCPTAISQIDGGNTNFVLNGGVFKKVSANNNTLAAGKAYLQLPNTSSAREISFIFDDETTGISATLYDKGQMTNDKAIYNLNGQRVAQPTKGMYIINGNKVIVK
jgi:hypothetical protein